MAGLRQCMRLGQTALRRFSTNRSANSAINPEETSLYKNLKARQEKFQVEDTVEDVYVKGGLGDVAVFKIVTAATVAGLIFDINFLYTLATETF